MKKAFLMVAAAAAMFSNRLHSLQIQLTRTAQTTPAQGDRHLCGRLYK